MFSLPEIPEDSPSEEEIPQNTMPTNSGSDDAEQDSGQNSSKRFKDAYDLKNKLSGGQDTSGSPSEATGRTQGGGGLGNRATGGSPNPASSNATRGIGGRMGSGLGRVGSGAGNLVRGGLGTALRGFGSALGFSNPLTAAPTIGLQLATNKTGQKILLGGCASVFGAFIAPLAMTILIVLVFLLPIFGGGSGEAAGTGSEGNSQILTITKTASVSRIEKNAVGATVTYSVIVFNRSDKEATNVKVSDVFTSSPNSSLVNDIKLVDGSPIETAYEIGILAPNASSTKTFTVAVTNTNFEPGWILVNQAVVTGSVAGVEEKSTTSKSVVIGDVPNCYVFDNSWTESEKQQELEAILVLAGSPSFMNLVCAGGEVKLSRVRDANYFGVTNGANGITIHGPGMGNLGLRLYILAHESGHVIGNMNPDLLKEFIGNGIYDAEGLMPTYAKEIGLPTTNCGTEQINVPFQCYDESFAELTSGYVIYKTYSFPGRSWSGYPGGVWFNHPSSTWNSFNTDRPKHFDFAKNQIFGGFAF